MNTPQLADVPSWHHPSLERLFGYVKEHNRVLGEVLGSGNEGLVYSTTTRSAIKVYRHGELYENERNVYFRIRDRELKSVEGFHIPKLLHWSDEHWVIEMSIVLSWFSGKRNSCRSALAS
ncbi:MAG: hypothetical protein AB7O38_26690 [Pirellulaceae bacterium]